MSKTKISGLELCGLTKSELFDEIITNNYCPNTANEKFTYEDCEDGKESCDCDCVRCWRVNLGREYEVETD